jgi:AraC-like DNA-binding protein
VNDPQDLEKLSEPFRALIGNQGLNYQLLDLLPTPIHIFAPDGLSMFMNRAYMEMVNHHDASLIVGKYNLKNDPVCLEIMGQELMDRIFNGEACSMSDFPAPIQDVADRGAIEEKPFEAATMDIFNLPLWDGDTFVCTISFFTVKNMYKGKPEVVKSKKYIDEHWQDEFSENDIAKAVNVSPRHLRLLFRNCTGVTMYDYYKSVKVDHIKEKLANKNSTVSETFSFCGLDSRGGFGKIFKQLTGMTPKEYKNSLK